MQPEHLDSFFTAVLGRFGLHGTNWRLDFFREWARHENTGARWNPLATTQPGGEYPEDPYWNTFGDAGQYHARNYDTMNDGITATAATLALSYYPAIIDTLSNEIPHPALPGAVRKWGTTSFADQLAAGWLPTYDPSRPEQPPTVFGPSPASPPASTPAPFQMTLPQFEGLLNSARTMLETLDAIEAAAARSN